MYENGDKVKLENGCIATISEDTSSSDMTDAYMTYENILVTPDMIIEKIKIL